MSVGPGKYDAECTVAREASDGSLVALIVIAGRKGSGFSLQVTRPDLLFGLPDYLRTMADSIEADLTRQGDAGEA
jgi:hypothetical protein